MFTSICLLKSHNGNTLRHQNDVNGIILVWLLKSVSPSKKGLFYLLPWKPFKNDEKCFLFHFFFKKSSFRSSNIKILVSTFLIMWENGLIRKLMFHFKTYDATTWNANNYNRHIPQHRKVKTTRQWNLIS